MANTAVLKEFLVAIGFKVDDGELRKVDAALEKAGGWLIGFGETAVVMSGIVEKAVSQTAQKFDQLYISSQRVGSSVKNIQAFSFAAQMIGVDAKDAQAAVEGMARAIRMNPGLNGLLNQMGIKPTGDTVGELNELVQKLSKMPSRALALQRGAQFGLDSDTLNMMLNHPKEMQEATNERNKMIADAGLNPDDLGKKSFAFERDMIRFHTSMDILTALIAERFMPLVDLLVKSLTEVVKIAGGADKFTHGLSTYLGVAAASFGALKIGKWGLKKALGFLRVGGGGGAAVEGEVAAGALAAEEGGGTIAAILSMATGIGEIVLILAAISAAAYGIYKLVTNWDSVKTWAKKEWEKGKEKVKGVAGAVSGWANSHPAVLGALAAAGLTPFLQRSEGKRLKVYDDQGYPAIGYGHRLLKGESYPNGINDAKAMDLLHGDEAKALAIVDRATKGLNLSAGWRAALASAQFNNIPITGSEMIRNLRAGNMEAALRSFEHYAGYHDAKGVFHPGSSDRVSNGLMGRRLGEEAMARGGVQISQTTDIRIHGAGSPAAVAAAVAREQRHVNADLSRNVGGGAD
jgi:GH24 family phage-related lysozyme (muramidase)